jgi:hypothetical protein
MSGPAPSGWAGGDRAANGASPPSLQVQTVLYQTELEAFERFVAGVSAACTVARANATVGNVTLAVGDCSPEPLAGAEDAASRLGGSSFEHLSYVFFAENLGSAGGHNRLFTMSGADLVLVINPDAYPAPRLVSELIAGLVDSSVGVVEARQLPLEHPKSYDPTTGDTSWASGSCFLARSEVLAQTGGFDTEVFFMYGDDVDFSWRARLAGWRVVHRPSARVFHDKRLTPEGLVVISDTETRSSAEASVLLAWRYGRSDLALETLVSLEASPDPRCREAAAGLRARIAAGSMPSPLEGAEQVAIFADGQYAEHRFSYGDP